MYNSKHSGWDWTKETNKNDLWLFWRNTLWLILAYGNGWSKLEEQCRRIKLPNLKTYYEATVIKTGVDKANKPVEQNRDSRNRCVHMCQFIYTNTPLRLGGANIFIFNKQPWVVKYHCEKKLNFSSHILLKSYLEMDYRSRPKYKSLEEHVGEYLHDLWVGEDCSSFLQGL